MGHIKYYRPRPEHSSKSGVVPLRQARVGRGLTLRDLADRMHSRGHDCSLSMLSRIETGKRKPSHSLLVAVASILELPDYYVERWEEADP